MDVKLYFQDAEEQDFLIAPFDYHKTVDKDHSAEDFTLLRNLTLNLLKQKKTCNRRIS